MKKVYAVVFSMLIIGVIILIATNTKSTASENVQSVTAKSGLVLRSKPSTQAEKILTIAFNEKVHVLGYSDKTTKVGEITAKWAKVKYKNTQGWVFSGYLSKSSSNSSSDYSSGASTPTQTNKVVSKQQKPCDPDNPSLSVLAATGAYEEKDYAEAISIYQKACDEERDTLACFFIGFIYKEGEGGNQDYNKAAYFLQKACDGGCDNACTSVAILYDEGKGVKQDYTKAVHYYQKACDAGETLACTNLGVLYAKGKGVSRNLTKAMSLLKKACDEGSTQGCSNKAILEEAQSSNSSSGSSSTYIVDWGYDFSGDDRIWGRNQVKLNNGREIYTWLSRESYGSKCYTLNVQGSFYGVASLCSDSIESYSNWSASCKGSGGQFWVRGDHVEVLKEIVSRCGGY